MDYKNILEKLPYADPFLFVDELQHVDNEGVKGVYTFNENLSFYKGHFKGQAVTPGVILTECCAQIGLVSLGLYILIESNTLNNKNIKIAMSSSQMEFYLPVYPNEKVVVTSHKTYFRFHKLKCDVKMHNMQGRLICKGNIAGMFKATSNE